MGLRSNGESWGLGLLMVLFLDEEDDIRNPKKNPKKKVLTKNLGLISKAQFTISLCGLIAVFTILLFTICTYSDPPPKPSMGMRGVIPRRWLKESKKRGGGGGGETNNNHHYYSPPAAALQGMGNLFRRGTQSMTELVVAHLTEDTTSDDLRWFLRTLHRSALTSRADLVLIFPSSLSLSTYFKIITQENQSFKLLLFAETDKTRNFSTNFKKPTPTSFTKETLWGRGTRKNSKYEDEEEEDEDGYGYSWGSIVGFEAAELDPEDSLSGFLDPVPMQLRRWGCYQMLLGRLRRSFNHVLLIGINDALILGDALSPVRNRTSEAIHLWGFKNDASDFVPPRNGNAAIIMGGIRGVRRLSNAMLTETVRVSMMMRRKKKKKKKPPSIDDSMLLTHLLANNSVLNNKVKVTTELLPGSNLIGYPTTASTSTIANSLFSSSNYMALIRHHGDDGNNLNLTSFLRREICSSPIESSVYMDC